MPVGQIVGRMNEVRPVADVMAELSVKPAPSSTACAASTTRLGDTAAMMVPMKISVSAGYWAAGPPPGAADLFAAAERLGLDQIWTAEAYGSDAWTPLAWWGSRTARSSSARRSPSCPPGRRSPWP